MTMELDEYPSPAFMKRARLSYGALFEDPEDKMEEDGGVKGKGRKRTRFGRDSTSWRYASQSPSPSPEAEPRTPPQTAEVAVEVDIVKPSPPKPQMADDGSQTTELEAADPHAKQPVTKAPDDEPRRDQQATSPAKDQPSQPSGPQESQIQGGPKESSPAKKSPAPNPAESDKSAAVAKVPAPSSGFGSSTLFGNFAPSESGYDRPRFGSAAHRETDGGLDIANQVRFGFSHTPQTAYPQLQPHQMSHSAPAPHRAGQDYPQPRLEPSDTSKYADMETYVDQAEQEMEAEPQYAYDGRDLNPPAVETFGAGQFDIATQSRGYNPVEGGHFGADALDEGTRITSGGYAIHNDEINVDKVPPGFASFGGGAENEIGEDEMDEDDDREQPHLSGEDFVENDELEDDLDDEVAVDDRDMTEYGPEGEIIEQGDYDQREYNKPEEDDDELSEEEHQDELQAMAQNNNPDVVDEDELYDARMDDNRDEDDEEGSDELEDGQGSYDEEEEEFDEDEYDQGSEDEEDYGPDAFYDNISHTWVTRGTRPMQPAMPSAPKAPVVIDLLSDSDDDEPPAKPANQQPSEASQSTGGPTTEASRPPEQSASAPFASVPSEPVRQDNTPSRQNLSAGDQHDAVLEPSPGPEQHQAPRERRKSSGSHVYGGNVEEHIDDSKMDLHMPSTPPLEKREEVTSPTDARNDVADVADDGTASSIPSFNGAAESKVSRGTERSEVASSGERGEGGSYGFSDTASSVPRSAPGQQENQGAVLPEPSNDSLALSAQEAQGPQDQEMTDALSQRASSPPRPAVDAGGSETGRDSADMSKGDIAEVERMFEDGDVPDQGSAMAEDEVEDAPPPDESAKENLRAPEQEVGSHDQQPNAGSLEPGRQVEGDSDEQAGLSRVTPSSPPRSQPFASQVFASSPLSKEGDLAYLPTAVETQQSQPAILGQSTSDSPASGTLASRQESTEVPAVTTKTTIESHVHFEQQAAVSTKEEEGGFSKVDIQMTDAAAEDEDEVDMEEQIRAQLQIEVVETTVQERGRDVTLVQENRRVSLSHANGSVAQAAPLPASEPDRSEGDVPVEPASLEQAIQEELMLQEQVDEEIASQVEGADDIAEAGDDDEVIDMEDEGAEEDVAGEVVEEEEEDAGDEEQPAEPEVTTEDMPEEPSADVAAQEKTGEEDVAVIPDEEEEVVLIGEDPHEHQEAEDTQAEPVDTAPSKPKQDLEVLTRPQTRSRRARDQQSQSGEAVPRDDMSAQETAKGTSPEPSKAPKRATGGPKRGTKAKETRDPSIDLAKASLQKRGLGKRRLEEAAPEPRRTRQRSASFQAAAASEGEEAEEKEEEDSSIALAKAALGSPSKKRAESVGATAAASRADLVKRLRVSLAEFTPLKALRHHKKGHPHVLAVVACDPPEPQRTKHRDFHTTVTVTDASVAPEQVVEVQFQHMHKVYLPAVKQGDTIVLRNFEIVSLPEKQFALKQREESSWAVYDADYEVPGGKGGQDFEIQGAVRDYLHDLRVWYNDLDVLDREKLATAVTRLAETGHAEGVTG